MDTQYVISALIDSDVDSLRKYISEGNSPDVILEEMFTVYRSSRFGRLMPSIEMIDFLLKIGDEDTAWSLSEMISLPEGIDQYKKLIPIVEKDHKNLSYMIDHYSKCKLSEIDSDMLKLKILTTVDNLLLI